MAIIRVQGNARGVYTAGSSFTVTQGSTPTNGNLNIMTVTTRVGSGTPGTVSSISQTGVVWSKVTNAGSNTIDAEIWGGVVGAGASASITVTLTDAPGTAIGNVCEYFGLTASSFLDVTASTFGSSTTSDTGTTAATTQANELWVGSIGDIISSQSTPTNGFTLLDGAVTGNTSNAFLEKIVSSTGTANSGTTLSASNAWVGVIATFTTTAVSAKIVRVQGTVTGVYASGTSFPVTQAIAPTNGNLNILTITTRIGSGAAKTVSSISQTGVTWSKVTNLVNGAQDAEIWGGVVGAGASANITINMTGNPGSAMGQVAEYSGLFTSGFTDGTASTSGTSTTSDTGTTAATTAANELWIGSITTLVAQSTPTNDFALLYGGTTGSTSNAFLEKIVSGTGTANSGTTLGASNVWTGVIATFKGLLKVTTADALQVRDFAIRKITKPLAQIVSIVPSVLKLTTIKRLSEITRVNDVRSFIGRTLTKTEAVRVIDLARRTIMKKLLDGVRIIDFPTKIGPINFLRFHEIVNIKEVFMRRGLFRRVIIDAINIVDKISGIARLIVGIAVALKTLGYFLEKRLHPTQAEGDTAASAGKSPP